MKPLIKYPGGKNKELKIIKAKMPKDIANYYEPFLGGGAVYFALKPGINRYINDKSEDLMNFYRCVKDNCAEFFQELEELNSLFHEAKFKAQNYLDQYKESYYFGYDLDFVSDEEKKAINKKFNHIRKKANESGEVCQFAENIEAALKQAIFVKARNEYNSHKEFDGKRAALFVFMRQYAFSGMFRYNSEGNFNVPYGGIAYNDKYLDDRIEAMKNDEITDLLNRTVIGNADFEDFLRENVPDNNDFVFLDPPYDTEFSSYANMSFDQSDQKRLADYLITDCAARWMVVIKSTEYIRNLYPEHTPCANGDIIHIYEFDKSYDVCIRGRNEKKCEHLVITNYQTTN